MQIGLFVTTVNRGLMFILLHPLYSYKKRLKQKFHRISNFSYSKYWKARGTELQVLIILNKG